MLFYDRVIMMCILCWFGEIILYFGCEYILIMVMKIIKIMINVLCVFILYFNIIGKCFVDYWGIVILGIENLFDLFSCIRRI